MLGRGYLQLGMAGHRTYKSIYWENCLNVTDFQRIEAWRSFTVYGD